MKTLELNQMENIEGGGCTDSEMMSAGAGMLVLAAFSWDFSNRIRIINGWGVYDERFSISSIFP